MVEVAQSNCAWLYLKGRGLPPPVNHTLRHAVYLLYWFKSTNTDAAAVLRMRAVRQMFERAGQQGGGDAHLRLGLVVVRP